MRGLKISIELTPEKEIESIISKTGIGVIYIDHNVCNSMLIPEHCGAYIITTKSGKRYVGSSTNIFERMRCHVYIGDIRRGKYIKEAIMSIGVYLTENYKDARVLERWLIYGLDPELNLLKPLTLGGTKTVQLGRDVVDIIAKKQSYINKKYGIHVPTHKIVDIILKKTISNITTKEFLCTYMDTNYEEYKRRVENGYSKTSGDTITFIISNESHRMIVEKQAVLKNHNIGIKISDIVGTFSKRYIHDIEELLGLDVSQPNIVGDNKEKVNSSIFKK